MLQTHLKDLWDMFILQRVVALFAFSANLDQILLSQDTELVRYGALLHSDDVRDTAYAQLALKQRAHDADSGRVAEHLEEVRQLKERIIVGHIGFDLLYDILMLFVCHYCLRKLSLRGV